LSAGRTLPLPAVPCSHTTRAQNLFRSTCSRAAHVVDMHRESTRNDP
jgi:hypothetical protein